MQHSPRVVHPVCLLQLHHADDSFLVLTTDGINFIVNSQEICDSISQCHDPAEAAHMVTEQVVPALLRATGLLVGLVWLLQTNFSIYTIPHIHVNSIG